MVDVCDREGYFRDPTVGIMVVSAWGLSYGKPIDGYGLRGICVGGSGVVIRLAGPCNRVAS